LEFKEEKAGVFGTVDGRKPNDTQGAMDHVRIVIGV
jgi:hypothetical protein